jgi:chromosome segregation ATPase
MNDKINNELIKIQDELIALEGASKQIEKAESIANAVISSIRELQGKYSNHLDFIHKQVDGLLSSTSNQSESLVKDLTEKYTRQLEEVSGIFENYHNQTVLAQSQNNDLIKKTLDKTDSQINQISNSHNKQIEEVESLLKNYLELAKSTSSLSETVKKIDFPTRLGNLENAAIQLNQVQVQLNADFQSIGTTSSEVLKKTKSINKKTTTTMIFVILIFIGVLGISLDVLNRHFPQLFDFLR